MSTSHRFAGKVAFVTGAASGIGRATAVAFAAEGARVAILDRTEDALHKTADAVRNAFPDMQTKTLPPSNQFVTPPPGC